MKKHTHYWIDKKGAYNAAREIVGTNLHMQGAKLDQYLKFDNRFDELWDSYNVLKTGWVEIEQMSSFYKKLMGD